MKIYNVYQSGKRLYIDEKENPDNKIACNKYESEQTTLRLISDGTLPPRLYWALRNPKLSNKYFILKLVNNEDYLSACTPTGIMKLLEVYNVEIEGKNAVVVGRSILVGKPIATMLLNKNATVTICHSKTKNLKEITKNADILVVATGHINTITEDMVNENAVVIDVGINRNEENKLCGDVDFDDVAEKTSAITPVPGGVGPMTIAMLMHNCVESVSLQ